MDLFSLFAHPGQEIVSGEPDALTGNQVAQILVQTRAV